MLVSVHNPPQIYRLRIDSVANFQLIRIHQERKS